MAFILAGKDEWVANWVVSQIPHIESPKDLEPYRAVAVMEGPGPKDKLMAGVVFHMWVPQYRTCQLTVAACNPRWASKRTLRDLLAIPFIQYKCNKVWTAIPHMNDRVIKFNIAIGLRNEGVLKDHYGPGVHASMHRMLKVDFKRKYIPREWIEHAA
jgi:hypothetical protein